MKITKTITESGGEKQVIEKILELTVKPGWKEGTLQPAAGLSCVHTPTQVLTEL